MAIFDSTHKLVRAVKVPPEDIRAQFALLAVPPSTVIDPEPDKLAR